MNACWSLGPEAGIAMILSIKVIRYLPTQAIRANREDASPDSRIRVAAPSPRDSMHTTYLPYAYVFTVGSR